MFFRSLDDSTPDPRNGCQHHWYVEPPKAPTSMGLCGLCGQEREFFNFADEQGELVSAEARSSDWWLLPA